MLGFIQLFVATKPITFTSIVMSAAVAAASATALGDDALGLGSAMEHLGAGSWVDPQSVARACGVEAEAATTLLRALFGCALRVAAPVVPFT